MTKIISQEQTDKKRTGVATIDIVGKLVTQEVIRYHLEQLFKEIQEGVKNEKVTDDRLDSYIAAMRHLG